MGNGQWTIRLADPSEVGHRVPDPPKACLLTRETPRPPGLSDGVQSWALGLYDPVIWFFIVTERASMVNKLNKQANCPANYNIVD